MSTVAYLTVVGARQGPIQGGVTDAGREGTIAVTGLSSEVNVPFDPATGAATGKRQPRPMTITKLVDQTTPKLYKALATNETLTDVTLAFWGPSPSSSGTEAAYFTIKLTNAIVVAFRFASHDAQDTAGAAGAPSQEVLLTYQKIAWTWVDGGITVEDDFVTQTTT